MTCDSDAAGVSPESGNILMNPTKSDILVAQAEIESLVYRFLGLRSQDLLRCGKAEEVESIVDEDREEGFLGLQRAKN